jgi:hypothetical protein
MADRFNKNTFILIMYTAVAVVVLCLGLLHLVEDQASIVPLYYVIKCVNGTI